MRVLKVLGIIFMVISSLVGGAAFKLAEVLNDPNPLPLPKAQNKTAQTPKPKTQTETPAQHQLTQN